MSDDLFSTVHCNDAEPPREWTDLVTSRFAHFQHPLDDDIEYPLDDVWTDPDDTSVRAHARRRSQVLDAQRGDPLEREETPVQQTIPFGHTTKSPDLTAARQPVTPT